MPPSASNHPDLSRGLHEHSTRSYVVAVVGATGAVGAEMARCLEQRNFPVCELRLLASARSAGKIQRFRGQEMKIRELTESSFEGVDIALFSAGGGYFQALRPHRGARRCHRHRQLLGFSHE